jgi:nicotinamide riboside kinase
MKICIVGTHGTGKTSLSYKIADIAKQNKINVKLIQEVARSSPFPINHGMTKECALWIYYAHFLKELEAQRSHQLVVSDRSILDSLVYAENKNIDIEPYIVEVINEQMCSYDMIIFVRLDGTDIDNDGVRSVDKEFQKSIDGIFDKQLKDFKQIFKDLNKPFIEIKTSQIFEETWKQSCLSPLVQLFSALTSTPQEG